MSDFRISTTAGKRSAIILLGYFFASVTVAVCLLAGWLGVRHSPHGAYVIGPVLSFATSSLFCVRKIYLITFANPQGHAEGEHDTVFVIYVLSRPLFAVLIALLSILALEHLVEAVVTAPVLSGGFVLASSIISLLLGTITGPAIDAIAKIGRRALSRLEPL